MPPLPILVGNHGWSSKSHLVLEKALLETSRESPEENAIVNCSAVGACKADCLYSFARQAYDDRRELVGFDSMVESGLGT